MNILNGFVGYRLDRILEGEFTALAVVCFLQCLSLNSITYCCLLAISLQLSFRQHHLYCTGMLTCIQWPFWCMQCERNEVAFAKSLSCGSELVISCFFMLEGPAQTDASVGSDVAHQRIATWTSKGLGMVKHFQDIFIMRRMWTIDYVTRCHSSISKLSTYSHQLFLTWALWGLHIVWIWL